MSSEIKPVSFVVPDGAIYICFPNGFSRKNLLDYLLKNSNYFEEHKKVRLVWDDDSLSGEIFNSLEKISSEAKTKLKIKKYDTNFFKLNLSGIYDIFQSNPSLKWNNFNQNFVWREVDKENKDHLEIVKDFMVSSFAVDFINDENGKIQKIVNQTKVTKILDGFENRIKNSDYKIYLVNDFEGRYAGCFSLVQVGTDVQLHSVAGISQKLTPTVGKRMPILLSAMLDIIHKEDTFNSTKKISFSNSKEKVTKKYRDLGFKPDPKRKGYFVEWK